MRRLLLAATAAACMSSLPAAAQFQKPEDAIKYRQAVMTLMNEHFGRVAAMAQGKAPFDAKAAAENAALGHMLAAQALAGFGPSTDKGRPNRAKPAVWSSPADFKSKAETMQSAMAKFAEASKSGNLEAIKATVDDLGKACKSCHDDYRAKDYSN